MYWLIGIAIVWVAVGLGSYWWGWVRFYKKNPHAWSSRHHGLLSFSDNQMRAMYALWPLTLIGTGLFIAVCRGSRYYFTLRDRYERRKAQSDRRH